MKRIEDIKKEYFACMGYDLKPGDRVFWKTDGVFVPRTFYRYDSTYLCGIGRDGRVEHWVNRENLRRISWMEELALCAGDDDGTSQEEGSKVDP